ncbi:MAG: TonB-dependent receptor [Chitinophagaceae bacterium]|nr:TonB-dependent receptor [Chitinophagaceae bacterium]
MSGAYTLNDFKYGNFVKGKTDFSGKKLPSVPAQTIALLADIKFKKGIYFNSTYYHATKIFLDDANTVAAGAYHLLGCRAGWNLSLTTRVKLNVYAGIDNLFNETYSLGNDINAAAGRYYNAAPKRNYYAGISFQWNKPSVK